MSTRYSKQFQYQPTLLYRVVFGASWVRFATMLLFMFFTIHPATQAFGAEQDVVQEAEREVTSAVEEETTSAVEEVPTPPPSPDVTDEAQKAEAIAVDAEAKTLEQGDLIEENTHLISLSVTDESESDSESAEPTQVTANEAVAVEETFTDISVTEEENLVDLVVGAEKSSSSPETSDGETVSATTSSVTSGGVLGVASSTPVVVDDVADDVMEQEEGDVLEMPVTPEEPSVTQPLSEEPVTPEVPKKETDVSPVTLEETVDDSEHEQEDTVVPAPEYFEIDNELEHSSDHYQFQKTQCISMGDGGYYCAEKQLMDVDHSSGDSLYTALDADGDMEIYLRTKGKVDQITDNIFDDAAPYYDPVSDSIVWHRLIKGRYQVMSFEDGEETQITQSRNNSMEPKRSGAYIVWQEWVLDNWEVMLFDGEEIQQLTESSIHDVAPYVQGGYVIWTTTNGQESAVSVHDIATGLTSDINHSDGGRVENPRFVLVYDEKLDNGDVITKGFNPETGEVTPLSAQPGSIPEKVPAPDPTGETRALIQNKPGGREDFSDAISPDTARSTSTDNSTATAGITTADTTGLATSSDDVVVTEQIIADLALGEQTATSSDVLPLTDFDIIVEPFSASSSAQDDGVASTTNTVE